MEQQMERTGRTRPRSIRIDDELWERVERAARQQAVREDRRVTVSDWIREALEERLERER